MKTTIIGIGNMGGTLAQVFLEQKVISPTNLVLCSRRQESLISFEKIKGLVLTTNSVEAVVHSLLIILAVKPKDIETLALSLKNNLRPGTLVISIAAGIKIDSLQQWLGKQVAIVRVMPNTPAQIGMGMSGWSANRLVSERQKQVVRRLLKALGEEMWIENEELLDQVTAISGSGPAYFYYFVEALIHAGVKLHLSHNQARTLVVQTFLGAAQLLKVSGKEPAGLRLAVTSKGGTTEAGISFMQANRFEKIIEAAVRRAYTRAKELSHLT